MKYEYLLRELLKREGKKQGVNRAQMREILGCLADIVLESYMNKDCTPHDCTDCGVDVMLCDLGAKRSEKLFRECAKRKKKS